MTLTYEKVILLSARKYIDQPRKAALTQFESTRPMAQALLETVELALEKAYLADSGGYK